MALPYPPLKACLCGSGRSYARCCQPLHLGTPAATPGELMRARYAAFALQDGAFVLETWHPDHRPHDLNLADGTRYTGLTLHHEQGNEVEFTVGLKLPDGRPHRFRERSRFALLEGRWVYVDGDVLSPG